MTYRYVTTEVEVDLDDFDTDELIDELERRGMDYNDRHVDADQMREVLERIWMNRRNGRDYQNELDQLIYGVLGKII